MQKNSTQNACQLSFVECWTLPYRNISKSHKCLSTSLFSIGQSNKWVQKRYTFTAHRFPSLKIAALAFVLYCSFCELMVCFHRQIINYAAESEIIFMAHTDAAHNNPCGGSCDQLRNELSLTWILVCWKKLIRYISCQLMQIDDKIKIK